MPDFKKLPLDAQLTALLDGETTPEEKHELEERIASDEGARRLYDKLRHGADFGRRRLDDVLKEPVPLALVRSKAADDPQAMAESARLQRLLTRASGWTRPAFPLSGADVLAAGVAAGPAVGKVLGALETEWVEGNFTLDRAALMARLETLAKDA